MVENEVRVGPQQNRTKTKTEVFRKWIKADDEIVYLKT